MSETDEMRAELSAVSSAIGSVRFMDPPDGGSVTLAEQVSRMRAELEALEAALTPSAATKAAYIGEFSFGVTLSAGGDEDYRRITVPWTTVKEIMAAIRAYAAEHSDEH